MLLGTWLSGFELEIATSLEDRDWQTDTVEEKSWGRAAERHGIFAIERVPFGVMLCVNMQTSFLHPPFGFALFYLRGVAPKEVKSSDIYWGAMPWIGLQAIMVVLVIAFPVTVTGLLDTPLKVDLDKIKIEVPEIEPPPPLDFGQPKQ